LHSSRLIRLLDIDLSWRMNRVSDGQRRRVQIAMGLLKPYQVGSAATAWAATSLVLDAPMALQC
jgi:hypothetical protein